MDTNRQLNDSDNDDDEQIDREAPKEDNCCVCEKFSHQISILYLISRLSAGLNVTNVTTGFT